MNNVSHHIFGLGCGACLRDGKSGDGTTSQEETNEQAAAQTGGSQSPVVIATGSSTIGGVRTGGGIGAAQNGGVGNTDITTVETSDPAVTLTALNVGQNVTDTALTSNTDVSEAALALAGNSLSDNESVATAAIQSGVYDTELNDQFGEDALQSTANAEAASTTGLEAESTESQQTASNALAAAQNETLAGVTPAQEFQSVSATPGAQSSSRLSTVATWLAVIVGLISVFYFLKKGKPA